MAIALFLKIGLDINSTDQRLSSPLHWAAFAGAEHALQFILAWGGNPNSKDIKGLTPLHLAVKTSEDLLSQRPIRALLLKGSDPSILDVHGMTAHDYLNSYQDQNPSTV